MDDLLTEAIENPDDACRRADEVIASAADPIALSYAHQARGIALRDAGRDLDALRELRLALRYAHVAGNADRDRDVRATYGTALVLAGRTRHGLAELDVALTGAVGEVAARVGLRKAGALAILGRHDEAARVARETLAAVGGWGNDIWEARTRLWLAEIELRLGRVDEAEAQAARAADLFAAGGATGEGLSVLETRGAIAFVRGDVAEALRWYAEVIRGYDALGQRPFAAVVAELAEAQLAAGLGTEAIDTLRAQVETGTSSRADHAELVSLLSLALFTVGSFDESVTVGNDAVRRLQGQGREWHALRTRLTVVRARCALDDAAAAREARAVADGLHAELAHEAPVALTLAGRLGDGDQRLRAWTQAASYRTHPNALVRAGAWHARALAREETGDRGGVLRAAAAGLDAIDEHRRLIGSSELRALATTHGRELTSLALRHAASHARSLLRWSERTRATTLAQPPATSDAATIPASLAALRDNGRRLAEARQEGAATDDLERERRQLERAVRAESHTLSATTAAQQRPADVEEILTATDDTCLVELVDVDGVLHVVVAHAGTVRRRVAGSADEIATLLGPAGMLLRRAARGRPADMADLGRALQEAVLGEAVRLLPDAPVILAPTARLHGLAWSLLPTLRDRPFAVVPSAGQWLRARATATPDPVSTVLVAGPALASGGAEVPVLARRHPDAVLLDGPRATLDAVLAHLDGAGLVHLAAHGRFRADSPLFSALDLADGPLTVHDLERVRRAPYRVVLSACESGVLAPVGAEELLGLAAALFSLGTAGLVCSVGEVNDAATADLMVDLHAALAAGEDPATALLGVRRRAGGDAVAAGTAAAFLALGV